MDDDRNLFRIGWKKGGTTLRGRQLQLKTIETFVCQIFSNVRSSSLEFLDKFPNFCRISSKIWLEE